LVRDSCSVCVATSLIVPTHGAANVSDRAAEIEVALTVAMLVPVREHELDPNAVNDPGGAVMVSVNCVPAIVPDSVPLMTSPFPPVGVMTNVPVTVVPLCVSVAVIGLERLGRVSVPDQLPARLIGDEEGLVLDEPHAPPSAITQIAAKLRMTEHTTLPGITLSLVWSMYGENDRES
jgi:hypothetical protein